MSFHLRHLTFLLVPAALLTAGIAQAGPRADQGMVQALAETNANRQYMVESVSISGVEVAKFHDAKLTPSLRRRIVALVGAPCDMSAIGELAGRIRTSLHLQDVREHLSRGSSPDRVRLDFQVVQKDTAFDLSVPRFLYYSDQGWTAEVNADARYHAQTFSIGLGSNGDDLSERFTGFSTRYEDGHLFSDRVRFALGVEEYHDLWNPATRLAINDLPSGASNAFALYRARRNIAPSLTFALTREVSVSIGASFEKLDMEDPAATGMAPVMSANAATAEVDFGYTDETGNTMERWDGKYALRLSTRQLGSDYVYARHLASVRYEWRSGRHLIVDRLSGGAIVGQAPLFERFVLGNSSTLQGWDHYAIDPLGASRMVQNSVSYGYQLKQGMPEVFYDAGLIGNTNAGSDAPGTLRHSIGVGFRQGIFNVATAFPLCQGRFAAVFMAGMNY